ncbi:MAG TPA: SDR family NAD(P)-dependent oxidoreductase [Acidimicrobiales bacterium]|nr:SDR family NAD(P)-dependent oxidoreductase [Acidimicrobiales bacterium]
MDLGLEGKVAIVTGGGRGIGRATVELLAREGVRVAYCSRSIDQLRAVEKEVTGAGGTCLPIQIDLQERSAADELVRQTLAHFGDLDILVCNHGYHQIKDWEELTDEDWDRTFDINFFAAMRVCRAALPTMVAKREGHVVVVSAGSIYKPSIGVDEHPHYTAAKAAVANMAKFLSKRYGPDNIIVNAVLPGYGISPAVIDLWNAQAREEGLTPEEHFVKTATTIGYLPALHRPGTTEEFAKIIAFLVSGANTYLSGVDVQIDGGGLDVP